jgi:hypothetical protein
MKGHVELSREFDLLASCCRWNFPGAESVLTVAADLDWQRLLRLARFHRVQGLAWRALGAIGGCPDDIAEALSTDAARIALDNLHAAAESRRLLDAFTAAGVRLMFLKGLVVATQAYGDSASKAGIDIDLLVRPSDVTRAIQPLRASGYQPFIPSGAGDQAIVRWHRTRKESAWSRPASSTPVDLHTRLADNPRLLRGIDVGSPAREIAIGNGISLPALGEDDQFAYLAVHGASSAWFRLKWISDFAAIVSQLDSGRLIALYRHAQKLGAGRAAGQALLLADSLFGSLDSSAPLRAVLGRDPAIRCLHRAALRQLTGSAEPVEPTATPLGTLTIHWTQFQLQPGIGFKWSELVRQARALLP